MQTGTNHCVMRNAQEDMAIVSNRKMIEKKQHKVVVVGDSHTRGCAAEIKHLLNNKFEAFRMVNSGSGMEFIKDTARAKLDQLKKNGVVVVWGGAQMI